MGRRAFVRDRILHAAFDLFARRGYEAVSTREIAKAAEVGAASMFKHFPTLDALGREVYRVALAPLQKAVAELAARDPAPTPGEAAAAVVDLLYRAYDERPRALALLVFPPHDFTPWEIDRKNPDSVRAIVQRLLRADDDLAAIVWGAITGPIEDRYLHRRDGTMAEHAGAHAALVRRLITPSEAP